MYGCAVYMVELSHIHNLSDAIMFQKWPMYTHKNASQG